MAKQDRQKLKTKNIARQPERFSVDMPTTFRVHGESDWYRGTLVNLSSGGFCLQTTAALRTHQILEFLIDTVDKSRRKHRRIVMAKIVWKRLSRHGVQFVRTVGKVGQKKSP